jgi:hypothetical protein
MEFADIFSATVKTQPALLTPMSLKVDTQRWNKAVENKRPPRLQSAPKQEALRAIIEMLLKLGVIEKSQAVSTTQVHLVPKPGVKTVISPDTDLTKVWRFCLDYRFLNSLTEPLGMAIA